MSVLSRPVRHRATAPTQREVRIPLPRDASPAEASPRTEPPVLTPPPAPPAPPARRRIPMALLAGGAVAALAMAGGTTYLLMDDDGGSATVIAPAYVPTEADLGKDRAAAARAPGTLDGAAGITEAERDAAMQRRAQNFQP